MEFLNPYAFLLLIFVPFFFKNKHKVSKIILYPSKNYYLLIAYVFLIISLSRPVINNGTITVKLPKTNIIAAIDISKDMLKKDFYPNNLKFVKNKFAKFLDYLDNEEVAVVLFNQDIYLLSPYSRDYNSVKYLLKHLPKISASNEANFKNLFKKIDEFKDPKILVLFTASPVLNEVIAEEGKHAASDHFEDALTSRVTAIGCRRCGGGMAGFPFFDVVDKGVEVAESLPHNLIILEGSGATFPAYRADAYILLISGKQKTEFLRGYFGPFRIALADLIVVTMADEVSPKKREEIRKIVEEINPEAEVHLTAFLPRPLGEVSGKKLGLVTTSREALPKTKKYLEGLGGEIVATSGNLSNRLKLRRDLGEFSGIEAVAVELKAAAVDVVTKWALERGIEVIYLDNEPVNIDGKNLRESVLELGKRVLGRKP
jgi:hypothetical protein